EKAAEKFTVRWHAFELNPRARKDVDTSVPYAERLARKYQVAPEQAQGMIDRMTQVGAEAGIEFRFDRVVPTNTFDAHRMIAWARATSGGEAAARLKERLLLAYMTEGAHLGQPEVLARLTAETGLDAAAAQDVASSEAYGPAVREDEAAAYQMGVSGVPFFLVAGETPLPGAQPPEVIAEALSAAAEP
ncbi:MAG: DsbA family oxidoreductase, partial [Myxococcota bacterium]